MKGQAKAFVSKVRVRRYLADVLDFSPRQRVPQSFWIKLDALVQSEAKRLIGARQGSLL